MAKNNLYKCLYCIIGASGSGKTSAADLLESKWRRRILKSYTTRPKRHEDDTDHTYITEEEYQALPDKVATTEINGYHYCATAEQVDKADYYVVDWEGFEQLIQTYKGRKKSIHIIYLDCPREIREKRMEQRGDDGEDIDVRITIDEWKFADSYREKYKDYILKTINTANVTVGVVSGVINAVAGKHDRKIK